MRFVLKTFFFISSLLLSNFVVAQNNEMFHGKNKHHHKHKGRRERKNKDAYNPYIDHDTNKPKKLASKELTKENKRAEKQQKKNIRKEKRRLRRQGKGYEKVKRAK